MVEEEREGQPGGMRGVRVEEEREGQPGGMKGVRVTTDHPQGRAGPGTRQQSARSEATPPAPGSSLPLRPPPPSTMPVELFMRESGAVGKDRGTGGGPSLRSYPAMSAETAKAEVQWHTWKLENPVKKVAIVHHVLCLCLL